MVAGDNIRNYCRVARPEMRAGVYIINWSGYIEFFGTLRFFHSRKLYIA